MTLVAITVGTALVSWAYVTDGRGGAERQLRLFLVVVALGVLVGTFARSLVPSLSDVVLKASAVVLLVACVAACLATAGGKKGDGLPTSAREEVHT